jgi:hypothetical protein
LNCSATASYAAAGTWSAASSVTASVNASAARSRALKYGVSRHAGSAYSRCSLSPIARASFVCIGYGTPPAHAVTTAFARLIAALRD